MSRPAPLRSRPAPLPRATAAIAAYELRLTLRRGENLLVTIVIPTAVLLFFATAGIVPGIAGRPVDFLLPGALALAIIATGLVNLGIATAYDRQYGVLKRLGGSPLPRSGLVAAKLVAVLAIEAVQIALLVGVAVVLLGWSPPSATSPGLAALALLLGTAAFAGSGLVLAGTLRAEAVLALANGLFLAFLMLGGIVLPVDHLPAALAAIATILPATALSDALRIALGAGGDVARPLAILAAWAAAAIVVAIRTFRWD
jgi:ABC-2 type transport system permease protein